MSSKNQQRKARLQQKRAEAKAANDDENAFLDQMIQEANMPATKPVSEPVVPSNEPSSQSNTSEQSSAPLNEPNSQPQPGPDQKQDDFGIPRQQVLNKANDIWKTVKAYVMKDPEYKNMPDQEKMELFRTKFGYAMFMDEFPIVARYMVCHGQYSAKAFDRMLQKIERAVHPPPDQRKEGYMEDQWVCRQADYVQYLWESYQKRHYNTAERQWIWQTTYERLKKEFDDFRSMHKEIEERVKNEKKTLSGQNARELLERLASGTQNLSSEEEEFLLAQLKDVFDKKNNPELAALDESESSPEDLVKAKEQKILMIETVDVERMNEIDDKYKPAEYRGMEPILEEQSTPEQSTPEQTIQASEAD